MQEGLLVEDATGDITFVNPKAAELLGHSPDNLIGQPWRTFVAPEHIAKVEEAAIQQSRGSTSRYEAALLTRGGRDVPVIVSTHPMFDGGHFSGVLSVFTDITEQKQTEEELEKHQQHFEELVKERTAELAQANEQLRQEIAERRRAEEALRHRLLVLSQPAGEIGDLRLTDTVDTDVLQRLQDSLAESYGVASLMFDQDGEPITKPSNFSDFCKLIRATQRGMERCEASHASLSRLVADGSPGLAPCKNFEEIQDGAVPIYIGDRHVATWGIGQRVIGELPEEKVRSYAKEIGADADQLAAAARKLEAESKEQFEQAMSFLGTVATSISLLGLQNIQQAREITERKRAERESEGRRLYLESVLARAPDAIVTLDAQHNILEWNAGAERLFGYTLEEVVGRNIDDLITASDADVFEEAAALTQQVLAGESVPATEMVRYRKDGSPVDVIVSGSPILIGDDVIGVVIVYIDITERKQAEEALQRRSSELALINQIGQALTSTLDLDEVLFTLLEEIKRLLGVTGSSVWLIDPDTKELVCRQASGPKGEIVRRWRLAPGEGVAGWATHRGKSVIVPDIWTDERHYEYLDQVTGLDLRSILTIPLRVRDQVIGVLQVVDSKVDRFSALDLMLLEPLAATAAIAIENARLYEQARQDAEAKSTLLREINHPLHGAISGRRTALLIGPS
jgi:PAS domain S-box-containing protein